MKLYELHVHQFGARLVSQSHAVAGVLPRIGSNAPGFADAASGNHDRLGFENYEPPNLSPVSESAGHPITIFQQASNRAFHVNIDTLMHAAILQRANHFKSGPIAHVTEPFESMAAKSALQNISICGPVEQGTPLFQLANALRTFLRMNLGHAPVIKKLSAAHRVTKVRAPVISSIHIRHRCRDSA